MRRRRIHSSRGRRRKTNWSFGFGASLGAQAFITQTIQSHWALWPVGTWDPTMQSYPGETVSNPLDLTLVRSINSFYMWINAPGTNPPDYTCWVGMGLIKWSHPDPNEIDGVNIDSHSVVPGPLSTPTMDWVWRAAQFTRVFGAVGETVFVGSDFALMQSRAMRKLSQNEGLLQVLELNILGAGFETSLDVAWGMESRMLVKEP